MTNNLVFGLFVNIQKDKDLKQAKKIAGFLKIHNDSLMSNVDMGFGDSHIDYSRIDVMLTLGGDGTVLRISRECAQHNVPILGINLGTLGFLTVGDPPKVNEIISRIKSGDYFLDKRMMLDAKVLDMEMPALNEVAVLKHDTSRAINLSYFISNELAEEMLCDGLIVSTPTGSTGYSVSAGGAIVDPNMQCIIVTPICAHSLSARTLILDAKSKVSIKLMPDNRKATVAIDGLQAWEINAGQTVDVEISEYSCDFIRFEQKSFYSSFREKFLNKGKL